MKDSYKGHSHLHSQFKPPDLAIQKLREEPAQLPDLDPLTVPSKGSRQNPISHQKPPKQIDMDVMVIAKSSFEMLIRRIKTHEQRIGMEPEAFRRVKIYTTEEALELLGISKRTLQGHRDNGRLEYLKIGKTVRYRHSDIANFMNHLRKTQKSP